LDTLVQSEGEICTKSDAVPVLERTFKIEKKIRKKDDHKEKRAVWMKEALVVRKMPLGHA